MENIATKIYAGNRQCGKTAMLIKKSSETGAVIAVSNPNMIEYIKKTAKYMNLKIPNPIIYKDIFNVHHEHNSTRFLVDELQMMLRYFNIDISTVDRSSLYYLD